jgi:hypothetical protein
MASVFARVIWSLASELTGLPTAVAVLFPCGSGRVLEIAGMAGEAWRFVDVGPSPTVEGGPMHLERSESVAASLLVIASGSRAPRSTSPFQFASATSNMSTPDPRLHARRGLRTRSCFNGHNVSPAQLCVLEIGAASIVVFGPACETEARARILRRIHDSPVAALQQALSRLARRNRTARRRSRPARSGMRRGNGSGICA